MSKESKAVVASGPQVVARTAELEFTPEQKQVIKDQVAKGVSDMELAFFLEVCKATGLDPLRREIHAVMRWSAKEKREIMTIQVGIDGLRGQAESSGNYAGQRGPFWCGKDEVWKEVWLSPDPPAAAKIEILRHGFTEPLTHVVTYSAYCQTFWNKDTQRREPMGLWNTNPAGQLGKCSEAGGLRRAFPRNLKGLYIPEELDQMDNDMPTEVQAQRLSRKAMTPPTTNVPPDICQTIREAAHKINVSQEVANDNIAKLSEKWPNLDENGRKQAVEDILSPWRETWREQQAERKKKSQAKKTAGAPPKPAEEEPPARQQPPAASEHDLRENPLLKNHPDIDPAEYDAIRNKVVSGGDEPRSAEDFVDGIDDGFDEAQQFLGRQPGDEPQEEFEDEPF